MQKLREDMEQFQGFGDLVKQEQERADKWAMWYKNLEQN